MLILPSCVYPLDLIAINLGLIVLTMASFLSGSVARRQRDLVRVHRYRWCCTKYTKHDPGPAIQRYERRHCSGRKHWPALVLACRLSLVRFSRLTGKGKTAGRTGILHKSIRLPRQALSQSTSCSQSTGSIPLATNVLFTLTRNIPLATQTNKEEHE